MKEEIEESTERGPEPLETADPGTADAETTPASTESGEDAGSSEIAALRRERDELKDILLRKQAEFENFRKRTERERSEFSQFAGAKVVEGILDVLDSFELAIRDGSGNRNAVSLHQGFELIFKQLFDSLERQGLKAIPTEGQPFDPHVHQAVSTQPSNEVQEGMVLEELRKGYTLNDRLLRPAMVVVAASSEGLEGSEGSEGEAEE